MKQKAPETLLEAVRFFSDERQAWISVVNRRWPTGVIICPRCQSIKVRLIETQMIWRCNGCKQRFSAKTGTIFEESRLPFSKWLPAMWLIANAKNGVSSCELARSLGVTQKTAWMILRRLKLATGKHAFSPVLSDADAKACFFTWPAYRVGSERVELIGKDLVLEG